jgi:hypothetical protein
MCDARMLGIHDTNEQSRVHHVEARDLADPVHRDQVEWLPSMKGVPLHEGKSIQNSLGKSGDSDSF